MSDQSVAALMERTRQETIKYFGRFARRMQDLAALIDSGEIAREVDRD